MVKISLYLTTSKFAAYLILVIGTIFGFYFKDSGTLLATFSAVSAILMMKTYVTGKTEQTQINNNVPISVPPEQPEQQKENNIG